MQPGRRGRKMRSRARSNDKSIISSWAYKTDPVLFFVLNRLNWLYKHHNILFLFLFPIWNSFDISITSSIRLWNFKPMHALLFQVDLVLAQQHLTKRNWLAAWSKFLLSHILPRGRIGSILWHACDYSLSVRLYVYVWLMVQNRHLLKMRIIRGMDYTFACMTGSAKRHLGGILTLPFSYWANSGLTATHIV